MNLPALGFAIALPFVDRPADCDANARTLASLIDPAKLASLGKRGANPQIQQAVAIMGQSLRFKGACAYFGT